MNFTQIFDVFSRRHNGSKKGTKPLTSTFRNRTLMLCDDMLSDLDSDNIPRNHSVLFWKQIRKYLLFLHGSKKLYKNSGETTHEYDTNLFLSKCRDDHFLDFVEYIFKTDIYWRIRNDENKLVEEINQLFSIDELPYALTPFIREKQTETINGNESEFTTISNYPKIILREDEIMYSATIKPTLNLLNEKELFSANIEFIEALEDFRKNDFGDCLTKCGSAFESTMKIICKRNRWMYHSNDTSKKLIKIIIENSELESFFEQPLMLIATLRNRLSKSHGSGTKKRKISKHKANYAINATASAILLLADECL